MKTEVSVFVLRFSDSSHWPQQFVALDRASGGYPYSVESPLNAQHWTDAEEALSYAKSFDGRSESYKSYAIEQKAHVLTATVES